MSRWKLVLFDLDGTLADTLQDIAEAANGTLLAHGYLPHPQDAYRFMVGRGAHALFRAALPQPVSQDDAHLSALVQEYLARYAKTRFSHSTPYDGIPELLDACVNRGLLLGVLSNKAHAETCAMMAHLFRPWSFAVVQGHGPDFPPKPDPASALFICRQLGVSPEQVLYVGDTSTDMQTAKAAGFFAVGAAWGFRSADELRLHGANALAHTAGDVMALL